MEEAARAMFTDLNHRYMKPKGKFANEHTSLQVSTESDFIQLLLELGPNLRSLSFVAGSSRYDLYIEKCLELRELTIMNWSKAQPVEALDTILKSCGKSLTSLCIISDNQLKSEHVESMIRNCHVLESLSFNQQVPRAKTDEFWQVLGATLKRLRWLNVRPGVEELSCVERNCEQLEDVEIATWPPHGPVIQFYKNLGDQLRVLHFSSSAYNPALSVMKEILSECPNVMLDLSIRVQIEEILRVLGAHVRKLGLESAPEPSTDFTNIAGALTSLTELRLLELNSSSLNFVEALFNKPKLNLSKLYVSRVNVFDYQEGAMMRSKNVLDIVAAKVHSLHEFACFSFYPIKVDSFAYLLQSNQQLQRLSITYNHVADSTSVSREVLEFNIKSLLNALVVRKSVAEFIVHFPGREIDPNQIRTACVPLRGRHLTVIVGGVQYLPSFYSSI